MSIANGPISELTHENANTRRLLDSLPADKFDWKPHVKSFSPGPSADEPEMTPQG